MENENLKKRKTKGAFWRKFLYAFRGIGSSLREESSLVVHFICTAVVFILGGILHNGMHYYDWIILVICMFVLMAGELINTAIENLTDMVSFKFSYNAKKIKDVAAAAMLILSIMSIIISLMVLIRALLVVLSVVTL
ncbi:MAG: diacylglycerol kinase family protein [Mycoplasmoidaceae bacterium]